MARVMKKRLNTFIVFLSLVILGCQTFAVSGDDESGMSMSPILGRWKFYKMIYHGQIMDPINPSLHLYFEFESNGENRLFYYRSGEDGSCERRAQYNYDENSERLYQKIFWLSSQNRSDCQSDPDMQMGRESWSTLRVKDNKELYLEAPLGDDVLTLVWRRFRDDEVE